jgi:hypothetical protein
MTANTFSSRAATNVFTKLATADVCLSLHGGDD